MAGVWVDAGLNMPPQEQTEAFKLTLQRAVEQQVTRFVLIASDLEEARRAIAFAEQDPRCVVTVGIHPHQAAKAPSDFIQQLKELAQHPAVRAIGECGLDYNRNFSPPDIQRRVFSAQVEVAAELGLPLYLHERDALQDQLAILKPARSELVALFTHCFTGDNNALEAYQALDCYIGITGWLCDERRGQDLAGAAANIDSQRLLLETDAPYLLPRNIRPRPKSRQNEPAYLPYIAERLAELTGHSLSQLQELTTTNAQRLFSDWG
ncbi:hydrolase TatD [Aliidiomarina minuta]|uniref:Hydrolase TatD n=1 Tax=Aliidiomarina minuta TaxID=880057 RepID=A0A432W3S8_9GAMM|nr:TatD family hydrolase [Aliidiomarina minuta]RUO24010.1 hydrolase TatD [Aliidiomarina minuta]